MATVANTFLINTPQAAEYLVGITEELSDLIHDYIEGVCILGKTEEEVMEDIAKTVLADDVIDENLFDDISYFASICDGLEPAIQGGSVIYQQSLLHQVPYTVEVGLLDPSTLIIKLGLSNGQNAERSYP